MRRFARGCRCSLPVHHSAYILLAGLPLLSLSCQDREAPSLSRFILPPQAENLILRGTWQFHAGDIIPQNSSDSLPGSWQPLSVPGFWSQTGHPVTGISWYRTRLELPETLNRAQSWALSLRQILVAAEIYWDGRLVAKDGKVGASKNEEIPGWDDHMFVVPAEGLQPGVHELVLRVSNYHWFEGGMFQPPEFGRLDLLLERHETRKAFVGFVAGLFLLFGVFHLILYMFNRSQREYWLMAVLGLGVTFLVILFELPDLFNLNARYPDARPRLIWILMMIVVVFMYRFLTTQFDYHPRGLTRVMLGGSSLVLLPALLPVDLPSLRIFALLRDYWFVLTLFIGMHVITWAVRQDKPGSRVLAWGVLPLVIGGTLSTLRYEGIWAFAGFMLFATAMATSLSRKVAGISREVRRARDVFRLFVPEQLLDKIAKRGLDSIKLGSAEEGTATVLFTDIRSFAAIAENLAPGETLSFLNDFMQRMSPVIHTHGGFICQFVGDEIMAIFYTPEQAAAAVRCAIGMRHALEAHNRERTARGEPTLEIGIGVNTGRVILGTIGSDTRMESCVIGDTVNLASRIQSLTKQYGVKILIAESTRRALSNAAPFRLREVDVVQVKGKTRPVAIHEVFDADPEPIQMQKLRGFSRYADGLINFRKRDWTEAQACFSACLQLCPEDAIAQMYVQRCAEFLRTPPGAEWDGVTVLQEK